MCEGECCALFAVVPASERGAWGVGFEPGPGDDAVTGARWTDWMVDSARWPHTAGFVLPVAA